MIEEKQLSLDRITTFVLHNMSYICAKHIEWAERGFNLDKGDWQYKKELMMQHSSVVGGYCMAFSDLLLSL